MIDRTWHATFLRVHTNTPDPWARALLSLAPLMEGLRCTVERLQLHEMARLTSMTPEEWQDAVETAALLGWVEVKWGAEKAHFALVLPKLKRNEAH